MGGWSSARHGRRLAPTGTKAMNGKLRAGIESDPPPQRWGTEHENINRNRTTLASKKEIVTLEPPFDP